MRACIQRVTEASVRVEGETVGEIGAGLLVLLGVAAGDTEADLRYLADKTIGLRVFEDADGKMNQSLIDASGQMLVVSQFTLLGDARKGRRPSFVGAAEPELAEEYYRAFVDRVRDCGVTVACGKFRADMQVHLVNDGPVTILLDSRKLF